MTLYMIGLGLFDQKDISLRGLEAIKNCDKIYLEDYTSLLQCNVEDLEKLYDKKIILSDRNSSEQGAEKIVNEAKEKNVAFLVVGDPFSATTHSEIWRLAKENEVEVKVINNASILTAIGITGLQLYKFGKTTSIPFLDDFPELETPYNVIKQNQSIELHTLCLLDIKKDQDRFMTVNQALEVLEKIESRKKEQLIDRNTFVIGCARLGTDNFIIKSGKLEYIKNIDFGSAPHCLIIPGKMHFAEEEILELHK